MARFGSVKIVLSSLARHLYALFMISLTLLLPLVAFAASSMKKVSAESPYRFVEMKSYKEEPTVPPTLQATFDVDCGDEFVQVIREEIKDSKAGLTQIAIAGIVKANLQSPCVGTYHDKTVEAGTTFSGRKYEVVKILKDSKKGKPIKSARPQSLPLRK